MSNGKYSTGNTFGDLVRDWERTRLRTGNLAGLADVGDPGQDAPDPDGTPGAGPPLGTPANLSLTSTVFFDNYQGHAVATVTAVWDPVSNGSPVEAPDDETADPDRSPVVDYLTSYRVAGGTWSREGGTGGLTTVKFTMLPVGSAIDVRVRARTRSGQVGGYATASITASTDTTPPPQPTAPTVIGTLRGVSVKWDGTFVGGVAAPVDFAYVQAQVSLSADMSSPLDGGIIGAGGGQTPVTPVGTAPFTVYARLVAYDFSRNASAWSAIVSGSSIQVIPEDIGAGAVTSAALADSAVTADKILNGVISDLKLATGAVTTDKLADLSVSVAKVIDGAISASKTSLAAIDPSSGTLAVNAVAANNIAAGAVVAGKIATDAVVANNIVAGAITTGKIASGAVIADSIAALTITGDKINGTTITADKIATNSLTAGQIATGAITSDELDTYAVTSKVVTSGTYRTGTPGQDRIEIIDETAYDPYLGYNRSIRDTIRWIRGADEALVGEIRGYMGDVGAYGIHLNANVEIGNTQTLIHQVGKRAAGGNATSHDRVRASSRLCYTFAPNTYLQNFYCPFEVAMDQAPTFVVAICGGGGGSGLNLITQMQVSSVSASGFYGTVFYQNGSQPGTGTGFYVNYYAELVL